MQTSNKFKPCKKCSCQQCRHHSKYKQIQIRQGNRRFRRSGRPRTGIISLSDFHGDIIEMGDPFDSTDRDEWYTSLEYPRLDELFEPQKIGIGYTD